MECDTAGFSKMLWAFRFFFPFFLSHFFFGAPRTPIPAVCASLGLLVSNSSHSACPLSSSGALPHQRCAQWRKERRRTVGSSGQERSTVRSNLYRQMGKLRVREGRNSRRLGNITFETSPRRGKGPHHHRLVQLKQNIQVRRTSYLGTHCLVRSIFTTFPRRPKRPPLQPSSGTTPRAMTEH